MSGGQFVGRRSELDILRQEWARARDEHTRVVLVRGEAGIGKTALLRHFVSETGHPGRWCSGDPAEEKLRFGVARQLLGRAAAPAADGDEFSVGAALVEVAGSDGILVVDDLHWVDLPSARALLFALRRLVDDRLLVLLATRPDGVERLGDSWARFQADAGRVRRIDVGGLSAGEVRDLAGGVLTDLGSERLREHTGGNPLYVGALLEESLPFGSRLPAPRAYAAGVQARLDRLPAPARELLHAAAVLGVRCRLRAAAAMSGSMTSSEVMAAAGEAVAGGLVEVPPDTGDELVFSHPLARAAILDGLGPADRQRLHRAAGAVLPVPASFEHRVAAAAGGYDPDLAADLVKAASQAQATGAVGTAQRYLVWALRVDDDQARRARTLFDAVRVMVTAGDLVALAEHVADVEELPDSRRRGFALVLIGNSRGEMSDAVPRLRAIAEAAPPEADLELYAMCTAVLALMSVAAGDQEGAAAWAERALPHASAWPAAALIATRAAAFAHAGSGRPDRALALIEIPGAPGPNSHTSELRLVRGLVRSWSGDHEGAIDDLADVVARHQAGIPVLGVTHAWATLAEAEFRAGRWDRAATHVEIALSLGEDLGHSWFLAYAHAVAGHLAAARGQTRFAAEHATAAADLARAGPWIEALASAAFAAMHEAWSRDDWPGVLTALAPFEDGGLTTAADHPNAALWRIRAAEAHLVAGRAGEARRLLEAVRPEPWGGSTTADRIRLTARLCHLEGDREEALRLMASADPGSRRLSDGLLALDHGRLLLRMRRRKAAIEPLRTARAILAGLGAAGLLSACDRELAAAGAPTPRGPGGGDDPLSERERVIARLVAAGMTNKEVGAELFLSAKAIEYHLGNIFAKLGIRSRRELRTLLINV